MYSHNSKAGAIVIGLLLIGLCLSCSEKKDTQADAKGVELQTNRKEFTPERVDAVLPRIIAGYNVTKPSHLASDYDLGYTLFVISTGGVLLTRDASTEYDYRVNWNDTHLDDYSDSGAVVEFGAVVNLNSDSDRIDLGRVIISFKPGARINVPFVVSNESQAGFPGSFICETLLGDSSGIVCALGISSNP